MKIKALTNAKKALEAGNQETFKAELKIALKSNGYYDCFWDNHSAATGKGVTVEMLTRLITYFENFDPNDC